MFGNPTAKLASLFGQLAEIQKRIDDSARKVVEGIVQGIDIEDDVSPSSREALSGRDFSWYQDVANAVTGYGFLPPAAYEPSSWMSRPLESRLLSEYALGDGGAVVATWFAFRTGEGRPEHRIVSLLTFFEDGSSFDTVAGGYRSPLPSLETDREERLPQDTPVAELLARHRAHVAEYGSAPRRFESLSAHLAARKEHSRRCRAYRQGLGLSLVERYIEVMFTGDKAEVGARYLDAIRKHPEWYKYANGAPNSATQTASNGAGRKEDESRDTRQAPTESAATPPAAAKVRDVLPAMPIRFMMSATEDGRRTLTTFGMLFSGLPELLLREVAANHCRAARVLAGTVVAGLARHRGAIPNEAEFLAQVVSEQGARITITRADAVSAGVTNVDPNGESREVDVHLALRWFTNQDEPSLLLMNPLPDDSRSLDERLREACARLGVEVPAARGADTGEESMRQAHERAVARLEEVRARWKARAISEEKVLVKFRAAKGDHGEYVWLEVLDWRDDALDGEVVTPAPRVGLERRHPVTIEPSRIYDELVLGPSGAAMPALTDVVATDYGMDL